MLLQENKPDEAMGFLRKSIRVNSSDWQSLLYLGSAFHMTGHAKKAYRFYLMAESLRPEDPVIQLLLANSCANMGDIALSQVHLDAFFERVAPEHVEKHLNQVEKHYEFANFSFTELRPLIAEKMGYLAGDSNLEAKRLQ